MSLPVSVAFRYVTGSAACYSLSQELQLIPAVSTFKQHLKTELFRQSYASIYNFFYIRFRSSKFTHSLIV